jgi:hypothetical protein
MGEKINCYELLVGKPEGKTSLGGLRCRWQGAFKMNIKEI